MNICRGFPIAWRLFYAHVQQALACIDVASSVSCCDVALSIALLCVLKQNMYIGPAKVITDPFFLEGVLCINLTSHVSIFVTTRMIFAWHQQWSDRSRPYLVYRRDGYRFALRNPQKFEPKYVLYYSKQDNFVFTNVHDIKQYLQGHFTDEQCNSCVRTLRIMDLSNIFISKGTIKFWTKNLFHRECKSCVFIRDWN